MLIYPFFILFHFIPLFSSNNSFLHFPPPFFFYSSYYILHFICNLLLMLVTSDWSRHSYEISPSRFFLSLFIPYVVSFISYAHSLVCRCSVIYTKTVLLLIPPSILEFDFNLGSSINEILCRSPPHSLIRDLSLSFPPTPSFIVFFLTTILFVLSNLGSLILYPLVSFGFRSPLQSDPTTHPFPLILPAAMPPLIYPILSSPPSLHSNSRAIVIAIVPNFTFTLLYTTFLTLH